MKKNTRRKIISAARYLMFFLATAFVVTCCFLLFFSYTDIDEDTIRQSAQMTFFNVLFLSLIFTVANEIYRKISVERPVKRILKAAEQITKGDFTVRIKPILSKNSVNEFDEIISAFNKMASELSGVETLRTDFVANVSHELKTPLAVMNNYGTLLQAADLSDEKRIEYAKAITDASRSLADLVTNILKLNRLENQQIFPEIEKYNLGEQLCECMLLFEETWEAKQLEIETDIDEDIIINADKELLSLVWNNLLSNAVKFTQDGGTVSVSLKKEGEYAVIKISDTGCGMSAEVGKHIFEKFYQGDTSHTSQGNGLGLALVKRVIDIVQGEIAVDSTLGKGSIFCVKIKL